MSCHHLGMSMDILHHGHINIIEHFWKVWTIDCWVVD